MLIPCRGVDCEDSLRLTETTALKLILRPLLSCLLRLFNLNPIIVPYTLPRANNDVSPVFVAIWQIILNFYKNEHISYVAS